MWCCCVTELLFLRWSVGWRGGGGRLSHQSLLGRQMNGTGCAQRCKKEVKKSAEGVTFFGRVLPRTKIEKSGLVSKLWLDAKILPCRMSWVWVPPALFIVCGNMVAKFESGRILNLHHKVWCFFFDWLPPRMVIYLSGSCLLKIRWKFFPDTGFLQMTLFSAFACSTLAWSSQPNYFYNFSSYTTKTAVSTKLITVGGSVVTIVLLLWHILRRERWLRFVCTPRYLLILLFTWVFISGNFVHWTNDHLHADE